MALIEIDGLASKKKHGCHDFPWRSVSHNQMVIVVNNGYSMAKSGG